MDAIPTNKAKKGLGFRVRVRVTIKYFSIRRNSVHRNSIRNRRARACPLRRLANWGPSNDRIDAIRQRTCQDVPLLSDRFSQNKTLNIFQHFFCKCFILHVKIALSGISTTYVARHHYRSLSLTIARNAQRNAAVVETGLYNMRVTAENIT